MKNEGFTVGDKVRLIGSAHNPADPKTEFVITAVYEAGSPSACYRLRGLSGPERMEQAGRLVRTGDRGSSVFKSR